MRTGSAERGGLAASNLRCACAAAMLGRETYPSTHAAKLTTFTEKSLGRVRTECGDLIDRVVARVVGGTDGSSLPRNGVCKKVPFPNNLGDNLGRDFTPSAQVQSCTE